MRIACCICFPFVDGATALWFSVLHLNWDGLFHGNFRRNGKEVNRKHYDDIRALVPKDKLLHYHVSEGWEPLCHFLEVPVPAEDFPSGNDQGSFHESCNTLDRERTLVVLSKAAIALASVGVVLWAYLIR